MSEGNNAEALAECFNQLHQEFGEQAAARIIGIFADRLGRMRVTFPDHRDLAVTQRNRLIRTRFRGNNVQELAILFNLTARQIRNIVKK